MEFVARFNLFLNGKLEYYLVAVDVIKSVSHADIFERLSIKLDLAETTEGIIHYLGLSPCCFHVPSLLSSCSLMLQPTSIGLSRPSISCN
jgi:hypothetical protein